MTYRNRRARLLTSLQHFREAVPRGIYLFLRYNGRKSYVALTHTPIALEADMPQFSTFEYAFYHAAVGCLKASILLFYLELFIEKSWLYWISILILVVNVANNIAGFFLLIFDCRPVDYWNYWLTFSCWEAYPDAIFGLGIVNILTDLIIWYVWLWWLTPMPYCLSTDCVGSIGCSLSQWFGRWLLPGKAKHSV